MKREKTYGMKKMSIRMMLAVFALFAVLLYPGTQYKVRAAEVYAKNSSVSKKLNGWKTVGNRRYYYRNGVKAKGWTAINGKYYYFNTKGELQTNTILKWKYTGYCYVDTTGARVQSKEIAAAVDFVMKNSSSKQTRGQRFATCFKALCKYPYQRIYGDKPSASKISSYASYMLNNKRGNCYRYASALAYIARVLGYESRVAVGGVTARSYGSLSPHGWCEIKVGNSWWVCDCSMQRAHTSTKLYMIQRSSYPFRLRCDAVYTMISKYGLIAWR